MLPSRPLSILHVAAPGAAGGLEAVVLELVSGLHRVGQRAVLAAVLDSESENPPLLTDAAELGVEVHRLVVPARSYLREYRQLDGVVRAVRPAVVHTHGYRADLIAGLAARRAGVPWVATVHGFTGGGRKNRLYEWLQIRSYRHAQGVVAVSRPLRERLVGAGVPVSNIHVLPNAWAAKPLRTRLEARRELGIELPDPVIGWVGRLTGEKGADVFLESLALLSRSSWRASIIGDGRESATLKAQATRLGIADRITWHGLVPGAASLYRAFDVWVLSSRTEGTPIALFEAMAARVPVVATSVGGVPDVVSSAQAQLVPPEHSEALATALDSVLADPASAATRAAAAYLRLTQCFSAEQWVDAHLDLYRSLLPSPEARNDA